MKIYCQKCRTEVSNDFDNTLTFCTNCGEKLSFTNAETQIPPNRRSSLKTIILTAFFTAVFLLAGAGIVYYVYSYRPNGEIGANPARVSRTKPASAVAASEITKVEYVQWSHSGSLSSGDGRVVSNTISFSRDLSAAKTAENNYDSGEADDRSVKFDGKIDTGHFEKLAEILVARDFLNLPDSPNRISESDAFLVVSYNGGEKKILTSNTGEDSPEVEDILRTLKAIELVVDWKKAK